MTEGAEERERERIIKAAKFHIFTFLYNCLIFPFHCKSYILTHTCHRICPVHLLSGFYDAEGQWMGMEDVFLH